MPDGLLRAKYAYFFDLLLLDADAAGSGSVADGGDSSSVPGTGVLDRRCLELRGRACAKALGHAPGTEEAATVQGYFTALWDDGLATLAPAPGERLTREQFVHACESGLPENPRTPFLDKVRELAFGLSDPDGDGLLSEADWVAFLTCAFGIAEADARTGFALLDTDDVGQLGRMHVVFALDDYFRSPEPQPAGNRVFGPGAVGAREGEQG
ncbi:hypothetical protein HUT18_24900 [Streptomyces sp. NA04227]|uniref:EF-hand domain-containing protein n=1 Tax=Streptomyces sp. NA04227 TaxID=2742136 RepID=UPI00158FF40E|nr:hypothetical protein [Streptomyces sp. NA04227]QKW09138.1 hypothetical protein HUT18_24900 [Streptomyces sp. NA04227]